MRSVGLWPRCCGISTAAHILTIQTYPFAIPFGCGFVPFPPLCLRRIFSLTVLAFRRYASYVYNQHTILPRLVGGPTSMKSLTRAASCGSRLFSSFQFGCSLTRE